MKSEKGFRCQVPGVWKNDWGSHRARDSRYARLVAWCLGYLFLAVVSATPAAAQVATGYPVYGSFGGGSFDTVDNANLNVHIEIPVVNKAGRGMLFAAKLTYDNSVWTPVGASGAQTWNPASGWGWNTITSGSMGTLQTQSTSTYCINDEKFYHNYTFGPYIDPSGTSHNVFVQTRTGDSSCGVGAITGGTSVATDGSGYTLVVTNTTSSTVYTRSGININLPYGYTVTDPNGNSFSQSGASFIDTLGMTVLTQSGSGTPSSPYTFAYYNPAGTQSSITENYTQETVETNFGCSGIGDYGVTTKMTQNLVTSIGLPDGTSYTIQYEPTPNPVYSGAVTGRIHSITLPTGGTITYAYSGGNNGITCADGTTATLTRRTPDGAWTYAHSESGTAWTTDITAPADSQGNQAYTAMYFQGVYETQRSMYTKNGGTLLETVYTCYGVSGGNAPASPCNSTALTGPITQRAVTRQWPNGPVSKTVVDYDTQGVLTETDEYAYGSGAAGGLVRKTIVTPDTALYGSYIYDRPIEIEVEDGSSNPKAETTYTYNSYGNLTGQTIYASSSSPLSRTFTPNSYGVMTASTDYKGNNTTYPAFTCANNTAFPTTITSGSLTTTLGWDCNGGVVTSVEDANGQTSGLKTILKYDSMWRLIETDYPDGGKITTTYNDTQGDFSVVNSQLVSTGVSHQTTQLLDALGRVYQSQDNSASTYVDTKYDELGRVASVSNPYYTTSDPSYGVTSYSYDALNRMEGASAITRPDSTTVGLTYAPNSSNSSYCTTSTDEASKVRITCADALGRITSVTEDPNGLNYPTTYTYDTLNDLLSVKQGGQLPCAGGTVSRSYAYDFLSRLTSACTPESGTTGYAYPTTGATCSGDPSAVCTRTDARSITTTYAYDGLNRLTSTTYSDSTPAAYFYYDESSVTLGGTPYTLTNTLGRLSHTAAANSHAFSAHGYDAMGRPTNYWECNAMYTNCSGGTWESILNYDLAGDIASYVTPTGVTITHAITAAQRVSQITSSLNTSTTPPTLVQNMTYTAWGALSGLQNGCVGTGCTPVEETWDFNNRLQPVRVQVGNSGNPSAISCLVYNYYAGVSNPSSCAVPSQATSGNNGNVMGYYHLDNYYPVVSHTAAYTYDGVNRLTLAQATGNSTYYLPFSYTADGSNGQFGNMTCVVNGQTVGLCPQFTFSSSSNHITTSGYSYDAAGNVTNDGVHSYAWDAEGRMATVDTGSTATYTYDALGRRVEGDVDGNPEYFYIYDPVGNLLNAPLGGFGGDELTEPVAGRVLASYVNDRSYTYFKHGNALGSWGLITMQDGSVPQDQLYYPWGQTWTSGHYLFEPNYAAMTWYNPESDLFLTPARSYGSRLGRWMSPDPAGLAAVNPADPQSWNRYAYVRNNPTSLTDPSGLFRHQPPDDANSVDISDLLWDLLNGFVDPPGGGGSVGGGGSQAPFSQAKYHKCCQQAFGTTSGNIPGTDKTILSYDASEDVLMAAAATGVSATVLGATLLAESNGNVFSGNQGYSNAGNYAGTGANRYLWSVDVGPMQLNTTWQSGMPGIPNGAWGTNLMPGQHFNGNAYQNILGGAVYLKSLGKNPQNYVGPSDAADRLTFLNMMEPKLQGFLN